MLQLILAHKCFCLTYLTKIDLIFRTLLCIFCRTFVNSFFSLSSSTLSLSSWDDAYELELKNFSSHGDEGEVWFGEDALFRVLRWLDKKFQPEDGTDPLPSVLDLGCGNGVTCAHLSASGYKDVAGVDYSAAAIELAKKVMEKHEAKDVKLEVFFFS